MMCFGLRRRVDWLIEASVSEKRAFSILRAEDNFSVEGHFSPHGALPKERHQNYFRHVQHQ
jgi:hypothetical protein